ncbi:phage replisome organizer N-terminal domain-containing protein [Mesotoga sp.]|uniref:phage replisome organizer N-terminal domain-containing protein n=2 Tax=Mesotoga TaxID=1184396 RepID=UPI001D35943B|nr:phage replisome organizer N-terminal domain-containing protein [Mesotoga sp.]
MNDVKWIRINTDIFSDEKIVFLRNMPNGDSLLTLWIFLLVLAGKTNDGGLIYFKPNVPYSIQMLSLIANIPQSTVELGLKTMQDFEMIEIDSEGIIVLNWEKHQNTKGLEKIREQTKFRTRRYRERLKELSDGRNIPNNSSNNERCDASRDVTVTHLDIELDIDKDIRSSSRQQVDSISRVPFQKIVDLYHSICCSLPRIKGLSESRKAQLRARWKEYPNFEFWESFFQRVELSDFLAGRVTPTNGRKPFIANLQWITKQENFLKILEGNYDNRKGEENDNSDILANAERLARKYREQANKDD